MSLGDAPPQSEQGSTSATSRPVLIADDEPVILDLLRDVLEEAGFAVMTVSNGAAALNLVRRTPVALILTDLMMPNISGLELAQQIRSNPQTAAIPIVLMSAAMPQRVDDSFTAVIHKPFEIDQIVQVVRKLLPA